jgi:hypothetical protein
MGAGTVTVVSMSNPYACHGDNKVVVDWLTSTDTGLVSGALCSIFSAAELAKGLPGAIQPSKFQGFIQKIETIPGLHGDLTTTLPDASYDITITDPYGLDVTAAALADRSGTVAEAKFPAIPIAVDSELTLNVTNANNSKTGRIIIFFSKNRTWGA